MRKKNFSLCTAIFILREPFLNKILRFNYHAILYFCFDTKVNKRSRLLTNFERVLQLKFSCRSPNSLRSDMDYFSLPLFVRKTHLPRALRCYPKFLKGRLMILHT
jgi:hypothetical protein